ncbi:MAG: YraN family protein [Weeksellaceae bacterium]|nr:YraN family protein [Weeksellaceae bacterium]
MAQHMLFGKEAENEAVRFLKEKGYEILHRNWRYLKAEIDIIALTPDKNQIAIVEVKARKKNPLVEPELAVNRKKKNMLISGADQFVISNDIELECRFDIISIEKSGKEWLINHIENAFAAYE